MRRTGGRGGTGGVRREAVRLKRTRGRTVSSQLWLTRQLNDPYVAEARRLGYRSRAAFKLAEMDDKAHILKPGMRVVDLGAAPGGWSQVAVQRVRADRPGGGTVIALDEQAMAPIPGTTIMLGDFTDNDVAERLLDSLGGKVDVVLSDLSPAATGHAKTDHIRIVALVEMAAEFAFQVLSPGGAFVTKVFEGGTEQVLLLRLKRAFATIRHVKPPASRKESAEMYLVATGFRGDKKA